MSEGKKNISINLPIVNVLVGDTDRFSLENRIYNLSCLIIIIALIPAFFWNASLKLPTHINIIVALFHFTYGILYFYARFKKRFNNLIYILVTLAGLSVIWFTSEGSKGSAPIMYVVAIIIFISISHPKHHIYYLILTILNVVIVYLLEKFFYDDLILKYHSIEYKELDILFSAGVGLFISFFLVSFFKKIHEKENAVILKQKKELQNLNSSKDKFFSIIAHDLRSPFNLFLGLTELLNKKYSSLSKEELQTLTQTINNTAKETYNLLENLLHWARVQGDTISFEPATLYLRPIVERVVNMNVAHCEKKNIKIQIDIPVNLTVYADSNMLLSIMGNLISNALKFTNTHGEVAINVSTDETGAAKISVKDNGIGMEEKILENLFKMDVKVNREGTDGEGITGLGLLLCYEFVQRHQGEIWAESTVNKGSTLSFTLPAKTFDIKKK